MAIDLVPIPDGSKCQEASILSTHSYIPCGRPAVAIVYSDRDRRGYLMCIGCASHNLSNRGGKLVTAKDGKTFGDLREGRTPPLIAARLLGKKDYKCKSCGVSFESASKENYPICNSCVPF